MILVPKGGGFDKLVIVEPELEPTVAKPTKAEREAAKAKRVVYATKLATAQDSLDRWLTKLLRASNQVDSLRKQVKYLTKKVNE